LLHGVSESGPGALDLRGLGAGDYSSTEWAHPEIEYVRADGPVTGTWTGLDIAEGWRDFLGAWEEFRIEAEDYHELDDERVLVLTRYNGRGKASGLEVGKVWAKGASVFKVNGGKVTRLVFYLDRDVALADLGLAGGRGVRR
jgi:hypothetical protein